MRYEVKSLGAWAFVKVSFFLNLIIGFVIGLLYAGFLGLMIFAASAMPFEGMGAAQQDLEAIGPIFLILLPIFCAIGAAIFQTLFGLIIVGVYNLIAKFVGGFEMTLEPVAQAQQVQQAQPVPAAPSYQSPPPPPPPPTSQDVVRPTPPPPPPAGDQPRPDSNPETP